jgi:hypothetical protein
VCRSTTIRTSSDGATAAETRTLARRATACSSGAAQAPIPATTKSPTTSRTAAAAALLAPRPTRRP